jgi:hypothetical protein
MIYRIDQKGSYYFIYENDSSDSLFEGKSSGGWLKKTLEFFDKNNQVLMIIENSFRLDFWNMTYLIRIPRLNFSCKLKPVRIFKGHWRLENGKDIYDYYIHKGHRKSLFKNGEQIVAYDKKYFQLFGKETIYISADRNEPIELLVSFVLSFGLISDDDSAIITYDIGNFGSEERIFDTKWKPK